MTFSDKVLERPGARYRAVCAAIGEAIERGDLGPGDRLPSQRQTAEQLGIALGTVTRGYDEARQRGLITGEVGRGSFVRWRRPSSSASIQHAQPSDQGLDLAQNFPVAVAEEQEIWQATFEWMARSPDLADRLRRSWSTPAGNLEGAGSSWLSRIGWDVPADHLVPCSGMHAAIGAILDSRAGPGDGLAMAASSSPSVGRLAAAHGLTLVALRQDEEGILPESVNEACASSRVRFLYLEPTLHNPTVALAGKLRRERLAEAARRNDLLVLELDTSLHLLDRRMPTVTRLAPERSFFLGELWLALSMGLRVTFVVSPAAMRDSLVATAVERAGLPSALEGEVVSGWIESGVIDDLVSSRRRELAARHRIVTNALGERGLTAHPAAHHAWLQLPPGLRSELFAYRAQRAGFTVTDGAWFTMPGESVPDGVRICYGNATDQSTLSVAMARMVDLLDSTRGSIPPVV